MCGARHHVRRVGEVRRYVRYVGRQGAMSGMRKVRRHVRYVEGQGAMSGVWEGKVPCQVCGEGEAPCHVYGEGKTPCQV